MRRDLVVRLACAWAGVLVCSAANAASEVVRRVTVLDADANVIAVVADERRLLDVAAHWSRRQPSTDATPRDPRSALRLDVVTGRSSSRWLYWPEGGWLQPADGATPPAYRLPEPHDFERALGLAKD